MKKPRSARQHKLFDTAAQLPQGLLYRPEFIPTSEEMALLEVFRRLPLHEATYREYTAKRRIVGYGWEYNYRTGCVVPGAPLPSFLLPTARRIAKWLDIPRSRVVEALVTEYKPGSAIGWHVDREKFEHVVGISLGGWCTMRWRPLPNVLSQNLAQTHNEVISMDLEPRSCYVMQNEIRWQWQHSIPSTKTHRYSVTFRTLPRQGVY